MRELLVRPELHRPRVPALVRAGEGAGPGVRTAIAVRGTDVRQAWTVADLASSLRLSEAPELVGHLDRLDARWGRATTTQLFRDHGTDRGGFLRALVGEAERSGYQDLRGLQDAIPGRWLSAPDCAFCDHRQIDPPGALLFEGSRFSAATNPNQLFVGGEGGGHVMVMATDHRSTPSAMPAADRRALIDTVARLEQGMQQAFGQPVSLFINGSAGGHAPGPVDGHAHLQLFSGDARLTRHVLAETGLGRDRVIPVNGLEDYFRLYDTGRLRGRYLLTLDASGRGDVILIGDTPTAGKLAMRSARRALGLPAADRIELSAARAEQTAARLREVLGATVSAA